MTPNQDMHWTLLLIRCMALQKCKPRTKKIKKHEYNEQVYWDFYWIYMFPAVI